MGTEVRLERPYRVRFDESGPDGMLRSAGFMRYAQDLAWLHSESAGFGRDWYRERGLTWLVRAVELDVIGDVAHGGDLGVTTEVTGFRRVWARRRSEFRHADSERAVGVAITDWILVNARGLPATVPDEIARLFSPTGGAFTRLRVEVPDPPRDAARREFRVRRSDLDPMAHVNNAAYVDYLDEQLAAETSGRRPLPVPRRYRAEFVASAEPGGTLIGRAWHETSDWCYLLEDEAGNTLLRARVETDPASWVGG